MAKVLSLLIAAVLLLVPLNQFLGWAWLATGLEILPLVALSIWLWTNRNVSDSFSPPPGLPALLALVLWGLFQLVPLPPFLVKFFTPETWKTYQQSVGVLIESPWMRLSLHPKGTVQAIFTLCSGIACYHLSAQLLLDRLRLKQAALWLTGISGGVAVALTVRHFVKLFIYKIADAGGQYAILQQDDLLSFGLLQLLLGPLALAAMLASRPSSRYGTLRERLATFWQATVQDHFLIVALSALSIPFSLALLDWRFALINSWALALFWILLVVKKKGRREAPYFLLALLMLGSALVIGLYSGPVQEQSSPTLTNSTDLAIARQLADQYSLTGAGLGTYEKLYRRYNRLADDQDFPPRFASFFMRARTEAGWPFIAAAVWFFTVLLRRVWPAWRKRRNKLAIHLFAGSLSGLLLFVFAVGLLGLAIPVWLGYYVFVVAGLAVAASRSSYRRILPEQYMPSSYDRRLLVGTLLTAGVVLAAVLFHGGDLLAKRLLDSSQEGAGQAGLTDNLPEDRLLTHAALYDPLEASYRSNLAWRLIRQGRRQQAMSYFSSALRLDPLAGLEAYRLGMYLADAGYSHAALKLMRHGLDGEWNNQTLQNDYVTRLIANSDKTPALDHIRQILDANPSRTFEWLHFLHNHGFDVTRGAAVLAKHPRCYVDYGEFLMEMDRPDLAVDSYAEALRILQVMETFQPEIVWRLAAFFEGRQEYDKALAALLVGIRVYPEDLELLKASGHLHELLGLSFKAAEIYQQVLIHSPQDLELRQRLMRLEDQRH